MKISHFLVALSVICLWGANFSFVKMGLSQIDPFILTGLRFLLAAIPAVFFISRPQVSFTLLIIYGLIFGVGLWAMLTLAIKAGVSAGMASLLLQSSAFISVLIGVFFLKEKIGIIKLIGLVIAICGLLIVLTVQDGSVTLLGIMFVMIAASAMSVSAFIVKWANIKQMFAFVVWSCLFASITLFLLSLVTSGTQAFVELANNLGPVGIFSVLVQAYPVTLLGYWIWNRLVIIYPISTMAPLTLLIPVFGFICSMYFYGETLAGGKVIACGLIVIGITLVMLEPAIKQWVTGWRIYKHLKKSPNI